MASVFNRGTRVLPKWYVQVKLLDGTWYNFRVHVTTKPEAREAAERMQQRIDEGKPPIERAEAQETVGELMEKWLGALENRAREGDEYSARKHVVPEFKDMMIHELTMKKVVAWLDKLRAKPEGERLSSSSQRHCFNLLSRFFSWAIEREHTVVNPCRMLPRSSKARPKGTPETVRKCIKDEETAKQIFHTLVAPYHLIFLTGYIGGLRPGEVCGLRLSDLDYLDEEIIRIRFSRLGPLKEDKGDGPPKVKWAPVSDDLIPLLKVLRKKREDAGAQPEDLLFAYPKAFSPSPGVPYSKMHLSREWRRVKKELSLPAETDLYAATRHTWTNRQLAAGEHLDAVADVLGHSDPRVTKKHYAHLIRKTFPKSMHRGLGLTTNGNAALSVSK